MPRAPDMGEASGFGMGDAFSVAGAATTGLGDALPGFVGAGVGLVGTTLVASQQIAEATSRARPARSPMT